jgi:hypothetical protein
MGMRGGKDEEWVKSWAVEFLNGVKKRSLRPQNSNGYTDEC